MAWRSGQFFVSVSEQEKLGTTRGSVTVNHDAVGSRGQGEPRKKHLLRQVLFSMISVPYGTDQLVEKVFFDKLLDCEKHTQTRKKPPSAYKGTVGGF